MTVSDGKTSDSDMVKITVAEKEEPIEEKTVVKKESVEEKQIEEEEEEEEEEVSIPSEWEAKCTRVIDGDTIELEDGSRVRYIGIDTPETNQNYGTEATQANSSLVLGKTITLVRDISYLDKYGRILAYVYVGDLFVNAHLVREGFATVYTYPPDVRYSDLFLDLQNQAQAEGKGLWGLEVVEEEPVPEQTSQGQFCGSKKSEVYHYPSCHYVDQINPENLVWYVDSADARAQGKRPCKKCSPP